MSLTSVATLKEYLPEIQGSSLDTELTSLISRVESSIARYLGFTNSHSSTVVKLDSATYTLYVDSPMYSKNTVLQLPIKPLVSITSIHSDVNRKYDSDTLVDSSEYSLDLENSRVILDEDSTEYFYSGFRVNKIVGVFGFNTSTPPEDLVHAICVWCSHLQRAKNSQGNESITQRNSTISLSPRTMPKEVKELLRGFRNVNSIF